MRALYAALALFIVTVAAVGINTHILAARFGVIGDMLDALPTDKQTYEAMSEARNAEVEAMLERAQSLWKRDEAYRYCTMRHTACMEFDKALDAGISFYRSEEYGEYLAQLTSAKLTVGHLLFDEGLSLGNIL